MKTIRSLLLTVAVVGGLFTAIHSASAQSWTLTSAPFMNWQSVASSADGTKLVAVVNGGSIYTSTDSGATWTATGASATNWMSVASSTDGTKLVAATSATWVRRRKTT